MELHKLESGWDRYGNKDFENQYLESRQTGTSLGIKTG